MANQNKALYDLNERLKDGLKKSKEKLSNYEKSGKRNRSVCAADKCQSCGTDTLMGFNQRQPNNINISAKNSSFAIRIGTITFRVI